MENILQKIIFLVVVVGLTVGLCYFGYSAYKNYTNKAQTTMENSDKIINDIANEPLTRYDQSTVDGSEVKNLIRRYANENYCIWVYINGNGVNYCKASSAPGPTGSTATLSSGTGPGTIAASEDTTQPTVYINPTKNFKGNVIYDAANNIIGLKFTLIP